MPQSKTASCVQWRAGGFDAYQRGVSEAYWDASGEAVYAGKGIYDLRAFDGKLRGVLPDNAILSHDMLEGMIAGAGYVSDAPLYDGFPLKLGSYLKRLHRWTRGDWQLIRYLGRGVPGSGGEVRRNMLGAFDRWKVFANLFRSASAPVGLALLLAALYMGNLPLMALAIAPLVMPVLINRWSRRGFVNMLYRIAIWPSEAACILDAICRTMLPRVRQRAQHAGMGNVGRRGVSVKTPPDVSEPHLRGAVPARAFAAGIYCARADTGCAVCACAALDKAAGDICLNRKNLAVWTNFTREM